MSQLIDVINEYKADFRQRVPEEIQKVMLQATRNLEDSALSKNALHVNDTAKDFSLPNALGKEVTLSNVLADNDFVVLNFYRGVWCPYCNLELKALQNIHNELTELGAALIAISPQSPDASLTTKEKNELSFEVLSDANNATAKAYGLVFSLAEELRPIYESFGIDIPGNNQEESYEIPMPATYVINKKGKIIFAFIDEDYTKRSEPEAILDAIKKAK